MGVGWNWKTGMISDCYQLQENQRKNDPLTVKTPSPLSGLSVSPAGLSCGGYAPGEFSPRLAQRFPCSLSPAPAPIPRRPCKVQQGKKSHKPLRHKASRRMPKRYNFQHSRRRRWGRIKPGSWAGSSAWGYGSPGRSGRSGARGSPGAVLLPSCPAPVHAPISRNRPACQAGRRAKLIFPFRHEKRLSRYNT